MPGSNNLVLSNGEPVWFVEHDPALDSEDVLEVPGVPLYALRLATPADLAHAILADPCACQLNAIYAELEEGSKVFFWLNVRSQFPRGSTGYDHALNAVLRAGSEAHVMCCHLCHSLRSVWIVRPDSGRL